VRLRGRRARWVLGISATVCAAAVWLVTLPDRDLFARARLVEPREDFVYQPIPGRGEVPLRLQCDWPYCWLDSRTLLTVHPNGNSITSLAPRLLDTASGQRLSTPNIALQSGWAASPASFGPVQRWAPLLCFRPSPDGAWLLSWAAQSTRYADKSIHRCALIRGGGVIEWPASSAPTGVAWLPDGRTFAELAYGSNGQELRVFSIDRPSRFARYAFRALHSNTTLGGMGAGLAGVLANGKLLVVDWSPAPGGQVDAYCFQPNAEAEHPRTTSIAVPAGGDAGSILPPVLSPAGNRLAWCMAAQIMPPGWPATGRLWSFCHVAPSLRVGFWTTRPDGSDPQEIGSYTPKTDDDRPSLLQWTPDGRCLSFRHDGALYTVPAN
jgi:hypothetical protein